MASCLIHWKTQSFQNEVISELNEVKSEMKELIPRGANFFLRELTPIEEA